MASKTLCGSCGGAGAHHALVRRAGGCTPAIVSCSSCDGTGIKPEVPPEWEALAKEFDAYRTALDLSMLEVARIIGRRVSEVSDARLGKVDPQPFLDALRSAKT